MTLKKKWSCRPKHKPSRDARGEAKGVGGSSGVASGIAEKGFGTPEGDQSAHLSAILETPKASPLHFGFSHWRRHCLLASTSGAPLPPGFNLCRRHCPLAQPLARHCPPASPLAPPLPSFFHTLQFQRGSKSKFIQRRLFNNVPVSPHKPLHFITVRQHVTLLVIVARHFRFLRRRMRRFELVQNRRFPRGFIFFPEQRLRRRHFIRYCESRLRSRANWRFYVIVKIKSVPYSDIWN